MSCQISGTKVNQKEYLRKYLSGGKSKKKKKDKDKKKLKATVRIIDDDAQLNTNTLSIDEELLLMGEDAPQIVGTWVEDEPVIRSAPKWKSIVKTEIKTEPEDDDLWGKNATQLQGNCDENTKNNVENASIAVRRKSSDSDLSPIRARAFQETDISPPRKKTKEQDLTRRSDGYICRRRSSDQTDKSPPRKKYHDKPRSENSFRRTKKHEKDKYDSRRLDKEKFHRPKEDQSPSRKKYDQSSRRRKVESEISSDRVSSDLSPARKKRNHKSSIEQYDFSDDKSPIRNISGKHSKQSPLRSNRQDSGRSSKHLRELGPSERIKVEKPSPDLSPQRKWNRTQELSPKRIKIKKESLSPNSVAHTTKRYRSPPQRNQHRHREKVKSLSPPPTHKPKPSKTLEGKRAGLQDAKSVENEIEERRRQEDKYFAKMSTDISGRDAQLQVRNTGRSGQWRGRDIEQEDPEAVHQKEEHERKRKEKYDRWGKGLKQIEDYRAKVADDIYEASKPLARYADDEDLDRLLREKEHPDDPMLGYMRKKKQEQQKDIKIEEKPIYKGPFPPNRFNIRPGYRWDGVDRSNGFEKKWFDAESEKIAIRAEAYKYSVEDM